MVLLVNPSCGPLALLGPPKRPLYLGPIHLQAESIVTLLERSDAEIPTEKRLLWKMAEAQPQGLLLALL